MAKISWNQKELHQRDNSGTADSTKKDLGGGLQQGYELGSLTDGLVAYYPFDGDVKDYALNNDGEDNTSVGYVSGGVGTNAKEFDGSDDYVRTPPLVSGDTMTVSTWIYVDSEPGSYSQVIHPKDATTTFTIFREASNNRLLFRTGDGSGNKSSLYSSDNSLPTGSWVHVVATVKHETEKKIFINGALDASGTSSYPFTGNGDVDQDIGYQQSNSKYALSGKLDDLRIYDRALSLPEIKALYQRTSTQKITDQDRLTTGLVGHWPLNEDTAGTAYDLSGNNQDSTNVTGTSTAVGLGGAKARSFNGSNDYINVSNSDYLNITGDITITYFTYFEGANSNVNWQGVLNKGGNSSPYAVYHNKQGNAWGIIIDGNSYYTSYDPVNSKNHWEHHAWILDGEQITFLVDGGKRYSETISAQKLENTNNADLNIGRRKSGGDEYNGKISDLRLYNRTLSQNEIKTLTKQGGL